MFDVKGPEPFIRQVAEAIGTIAIFNPEAFEEVKQNLGVFHHESLPTGMYEIRPHVFNMINLILRTTASRMVIKGMTAEQHFERQSLRVRFAFGDAKTGSQE